MLMMAREDALITTIRMDPSDARTHPPPKFQVTSTNISPLELTFDYRWPPARSGLLGALTGSEDRRRDV